MSMPLPQTEPISSQEPTTPAFFTQPIAVPAGLNSDLQIETSLLFSSPDLKYGRAPTEMAFIILPIMAPPGSGNPPPPILTFFALQQPPPRQVDLTSLPVQAAEMFIALPIITQVGLR